jgi:putative ABC transport system permease protein
MHLWQDLVFAVRSLRKSPGLVAVIVLSLGLGIGVNTTLFNIFNLIVLAKPTAVRARSLVRIEPGNGNTVSYLNFRDMSGSRAFDGMLLTSDAALNWRTGDSVRPVHAIGVSANFFEMLGVQAWLGRIFSMQENAPERDPQVVVLGYEFWHNRLQGDHSLIGQAINLNGKPFTVLGVMGRDYRAVMRGAAPPDLFVPLGAAVVSSLNNRQDAAFSLVGRLARGVNRVQAQAAITSMCRALEVAWPKENRTMGRPSWVTPVYGLESMLDRDSTGTVFVGLAAPFVVVALLLLIACANVAGVMLARGAVRQREIAVRLSLGASRGRLVQTLLAESLILSMLGAGGGLLITAWVTPLIARLNLPNTPALPAYSLEMDSYLILYTLGIALSCCLMCGLIPAYQSTRTEILPWLKQGSAQTGGPRGRSRRLLVAGQVAGSVLLLMVCALFLRSLQYIGTIPPGFDIERGIVARVTPEANRFSPAEAAGFGGEQNKLHRFAEDLRARAAELPGVASVSYASLVPLGGDSVASDADVQDRADFRSPLIQLANVGPQYFQTMNIRVLRGREFQPTDRAGSPPVAILNETCARMLFPNGDALGKRVRLRPADREPWREIVGVVTDNKYGFYAEAPLPQMFSPFLQTGGRLFLMVRTAGPPATMIGTVAGIVAEQDKTVLADVKTLKEAAGLEFALRRLGTALLASMGGLGLLLAMIGLYGVLSWEVSRRTSEIGIRVALGANQGAVRSMVLGDGVKLVAGGIVAGLGLAVLVTLPLRAFLAGVSATDPITILGVAGTLLAVSMVACWFPVQRATRVDPLTALRQD